MMMGEQHYSYINGQISPWHVAIAIRKVIAFYIYQFYRLDTGRRAILYAMSVAIRPFLPPAIGYTYKLHVIINKISYRSITLYIICMCYSFSVSLLSTRIATCEDNQARYPIKYSTIVSSADVYNGP